MSSDYIVKMKSVDITVNNGDNKWWEHESKIAYEKDVDEPIAHYLKIFMRILNDRHGLEKTKKLGLMACRLL